jgi:NAD-dependent deacetylase sirtuin 4
MATSNTRKAMIKASEQHVQHIVQFLEKAKGKALVITGAGISTDSGIPDYRGPNGVYMRNKNFKPIQFQQVSEL